MWWHWLIFSILLWTEKKQSQQRASGSRLIAQTMFYIEKFVWSKNNIDHWYTMYNVHCTLQPKIAGPRTMSRCRERTIATNTKLSPLCAQCGFHIKKRFLINYSPMNRMNSPIGEDFSRLDWDTFMEKA